MKVRVNMNYGNRHKLPVSKNVNPVAKSNNRKDVRLKGFNRGNKATVQRERLNSAFAGGKKFPRAKNGNGATVGAGISRRAYLSQTARRYPNAAGFAA